MNKFNQDFIKQLKFKELTQAQKDVFQHINKNRDLIVQSATGTGKTHAFLFAIGEKIDFGLKQTQAIILSPTRELAMQTLDFTKEMQTIDKRLKVDLAIGGMDNKRLKTKLKQQPHIIISTPGKFLDILSWNTVRLDTVQLLILDEMDMMLDYGFVEDVNKIASHFKNEVNMYLFSATLPNSMRSFINRYLRNPIEILVKEDEAMKPRIEHILINHRHRDIHDELLSLLNNINPLVALIFTNTRDQASETAKFLASYGIDCVEIHGGLKDRRRRQIIRKIRNDNVQFIVGTDLAARGIDLPEISHVINLGLPGHDLSFYTHRAGRTGRSGREGHAISLVSNKEESSIRKLMKDGINFKYKRITKDGLEDARPFIKTRKRQRTTDPEILQILNRKNKEVKPGYKKKRQHQIEQIKQRRRRDKIQDEIHKQKRARARKKQRDSKN